MHTYYVYGYNLQKISVVYIKHTCSFWGRGEGVQRNDAFRFFRKYPVITDGPLLSWATFVHFEWTNGMHFTSLRASSLLQFLQWCPNVRPRLTALGMGDTRWSQTAALWRSLPSTSTSSLEFDIVSLLASQASACDGEVAASPRHPTPPSTLFAIAVPFQKDGLHVRSRRNTLQLKERSRTQLGSTTCTMARKTKIRRFRVPTENVKRRK